MNHEQPDEAARELILVVMPPEPDAALDSVSDEVGPLSDFIRKQPVLTLSIAFGLGLLVTSLLGLTHLRASRRKARLQAVVASLIDHKPMAALAAAVVAGAAARFGIEPEDLFPIFEAFAPDSQAPDTTDEATPPPVSPTPQAHPSPPQQSIH